MTEQDTPSRVIFHGVKQWFDRWEAMTPEERKVQEVIHAPRWEAYLKQRAWLDWCVENKVDPNLAGHT